MGECEVKSGSQGPTLERVPPMSMPNQGMGGRGSGPNSLAAPLLSGGGRVEGVLGRVDHLVSGPWGVLGHPPS